MKSKILFSIIFLTFLISYVSAVSFNLQYQGSNLNSKTIILGESVNIRVFGSSIHPPVSINVKLNSNQIYLENANQDFEKVYTITPLTTGTYTIEVTAKDGIESKTQTLSLIVNQVPDITSPIITLNGNSTLTIVQGSSYTELGATASDNKDGNITSRISILGTVNTNVIGTYVVTYFVLDNAGNSDSEIRTIYVVAPDTTNPIVTINPVTTPTNQNTQTITGTFIEANINTITVNGIPANIISGTYSANINLLQGNNSILVVATDLTGNIGNASSSIFLTAPSVEITSPTNKTYYKKELALKLNIQNANNCWYKLNDEANISFSCALSKFNILVKAGQNNLTVYANDSAGNLNSDSITFRYTKKTNGGSGSGNSATIVTPIIDVEPSGDVIIPIIQTQEKENYLPLYLFLIATTSLGIIILSIILSRKLKEIKESKNSVNQNKIQEPFY